ncbi:hypothetical protein IGK74_002327 [Enterococcus sp. AZ150]|uniref:MobP2 family relaxase n=1 Tax=Enterococcus sp. AZ150 TaxID=2774866 RepID=UPI003F239205
MSSSPAIICKFNFSVPNVNTKKPFSNYVDYMERESATEMEVNIDENNIDNELVNELSKQYKKDNFEQYINYTDREQATIKNKKIYAFDGQNLELNTSDLKKIKNKLAIAEKNNSLLWKGIVSFDNDFLIEQGIMNESLSYFDEITLKESVQLGMKEILKKEELENAFWWGNIHLNTEHIHVHVAISEEKSNRPVINYQGLDQFKGKFKNQTTKLFKSTIYNKIVREKDKLLDIDIQKNIAKIKYSLLEDVTNSFEHDPIQKDILEKAYKNLPKNINKNSSFKSNSKEFKKSKLYINQYIENYFNSEGKKQYEAFKKENTQLLRQYTGSYHNKEYDEKELNAQVDQRLTDLKNRMGNKLLKFMIDNEDKVTQKKQKEESLIDLESFDTKQLNELIDRYKQAEALTFYDKQEIGRIKNEVRKRNTKSEIVEIRSKKKELQNFTLTKNDKLYVEFKNNQLNQREQYLLLSLKPNFKLSKEEKALKKELKVKTLEIDKIEINNLNKDIYNFKKQDLLAEKKFLGSLDDKSIIQSFTSLSMPVYINEIEQDLKKLDIKYMIASNNKKIATENDTQEIFLLKSENAKLFKQLNNIEKPTKQHHAVENKDKFLKKEKVLEVADKKKQIYQKKGHTNETYQFKDTFFKGLKHMLTSDSKREMQAMNAKLEDDRRIEREEEREEYKKNIGLNL